MERSLLLAPLFFSIAFSHSQYASNLAEQLNQYCQTRGLRAIGNQQIGPKIGKAGPRGVAGPRGPPGEVNYSLVNEMITERLTEFKETVLKTTHKDCTLVSEDFAKSWNKTEGVFDIYPGSSGRSMEVYCDVTTDGGGWIVFQRRVDGSEDFYRNWADYVSGFGNINKNFWLGLEKLHRLTSDGNYEIRVDMEDWDGNTFYALYTKFSIGDAASRYQMHVGGYSGTAGDSLTYHDKQKFYTKDSDNTHGCAKAKKAGWWHNLCYASNLNGIYKETGSYSGSNNGIAWHRLKNTDLYSLKWVEMKFRPSF